MTVSVLAVIGLVISGITQTTPTHADDKGPIGGIPPGAPTTLLTFACEVNYGIPYISGDFIRYDHLIVCNREVDRIDIRGYISKNDVSITTPATASCFNASSCSVSSQYYQPGSKTGSWHGWTSGTITDDGTRVDISQTRSECLIIS